MPAGLNKDAALHVRRLYYYERLSGGQHFLRSRQSFIYKGFLQDLNLPKQACRLQSRPQKQPGVAFFASGQKRAGFVSIRVQKPAACRPKVLQRFKSRAPHLKHGTLRIGMSVECGNRTQKSATGYQARLKERPWRALTADGPRPQQHG